MKSGSTIVDTFDDSTLLTTEYDGLILDEFAFPSHSADGVVFDDGGPITNDFSKPVFGVSGYFTYFNGRTIAVDDGATSNPEPSSIALMAGVIAAGLHRCGWLHRS